MTFRRVALAAVAFVALTAPRVPRVRADCPPASTFTFQVERPGGAPARGVQLQVEAGGRAGIRRATDVVSDSGSILFCLRDASSGEMVDVRISPANFRVLYPSRGRLPLSREGSPSIVVCEASRDCGQLTTEQVTALIQKAQPRTQTMTAAEKAAFFREWAEYARQLARETNADNAQLLTALLRKERQVAAASRASLLLRRFVNQGREVLVRFDRHAERVLDHGDRRELEEMNRAYLAYNPVFDELSERADSYLKDTSDDWSADVASELRALIDEALEIHRQGIYTLNTTSTLIIDCLRKRRECRGAEAAHTAVQAARQTVRDVTLPRLDRFDKRSTAWLDSLNSRLFGEPAASAPPAGKRPE